MKLLKLFRHLRQRQQFERDMQDEIEFHLAQRVDELLRTGIDPKAALRQATLEFGARESHKHAVRDAWGMTYIDAFAQALVHAWRKLVGQKALSLSVIAILSVAMAINLIAWSIYQSYSAALPMALRDGRAMELRLENAQAQRLPGLSLDELEALAPVLSAISRSHLSFRAVQMPITAMPSTALPSTAMPSTAPSTATQARNSAFGFAVSGNYFSELARGSESRDQRVRLGRSLIASDDYPGAPPVIVLSDLGWQVLTGSDPHIIGKSVRMGASQLRVVGVMPEGFTDVQAFHGEYWISQSGYQQWRASNGQSDASLSNELLLLDSIPAAAVCAKLQLAMQALPARQSAELRVAHVQSLTRTGVFAAEDAQDFELAAKPMLALGLLVLLIACANLANLSLAQGLAQRHETALRACIGASRLRLLAQFSVEAGLQALAAALLALLVTYLSANAVHHYALSIMHEMGAQPISIQFGGSLWGIAIMLALISAFCFGTLPAIAATKAQLYANLKRDALHRSTWLSPQKLRNLLLVVQLGLSLILLCLAGLTVQTASQARAQSVGFDLDTLIDLRSTAPTSELVQQIEHLPQVLGTTAVASTPLYGVLARSSIQVGAKRMELGSNAVDDRYFATLDISILQGRSFTRAEVVNLSPVVVLSRATAKRLWPKQSAIGQTLELREPDRIQSFSVIGVSADVASGLLFQGIDSSLVYFPHQPSATTASSILVRVHAGQAQDVIRQLTILCTRFTPEQSCEPWSMRYVLDRQQLPFAIAQTLSTALALTALSIALVGLSSMVRFMVLQQRREIGVRLALGAMPWALTRWLLGGVFKTVLWGLLFALPVCSALLLKLAPSLHLGVLSQFTTAFSALLVLLSGALLASSGPARLALNTRAIECLREL